jgi:hypothetical protein
MILADDAFERTDAEVRRALEPALAAIERVLGAPEHRILSPEGLDRWLEAFRVTQGGEIWASLGGWIEATRPSFGKGVGDRLRAASTITPEMALAARTRADAIAANIAERFADDELICLPTTPTIAPLRVTSSDEVEIDYRRRTMELMCTAGLGGLPQLSLPVGMANGAPVGLSIMAARGTDKALLGLAERKGHERFRKSRAAMPRRKPRAGRFGSPVREARPNHGGAKKLGRDRGCRKRGSRRLRLLRKLRHQKIVPTGTVAGRNRRCTVARRTPPNRARVFRPTSRREHHPRLPCALANRGHLQRREGTRRPAQDLTPAIWRDGPTPSRAGLGRRKSGRGDCGWL